MIYVISDLHGYPLEKLKKLLEKAHFDENDFLYILGDVVDRNGDGGVEILIWLLFKPNVQLILGNHDKDWTGRVDLSKYFEDVRDIITVNCGRGNATLCHFPMLFFEGKYHIYGHVHARENFPHKAILYSMENAFNAGADVNNFRPVTFDELVRNNIILKACSAR